MYTSNNSMEELCRKHEKIRKIKKNSENQSISRTSGMDEREDYMGKLTVFDLSFFRFEYSNFFKGFAFLEITFSNSSSSFDWAVLEFHSDVDGAVVKVLGFEVYNSAVK